MMAYIFENDTIHLIRYGIFNKKNSSGGPHGGKAFGEEVWHKRRELQQFSNIDKKGLFGSLTSFIIFNQLYDFSFGILQVNNWMKSTDTDNDGKLSYKEFNRSLKEFLKITADDNDEEEK